MTAADVQRDTIRDGATIQAVVAIVWLTDIVAAYAAGARWFTPRFLLPSIGLLFAAGWIAFGLSYYFRRRVQVAIMVLAFAGAFLLWTYRLAYWPTHVAPWLMQTLAIATVPVVIGLLNVRVSMIVLPLSIVAYHIAKSIQRGAISATVHRELPAIAIALGISVLVAIVARTRFPLDRAFQTAAVASGAVLTVIGVVTLFAWSGVAFPSVERSDAAHGRADPGAPNIVMIMIDTLRADRLGVYGYRVRSTSPFIDAMARRGNVYRNAYATTSWTVPSIATMFTGLAPEQHRVVMYGISMPPSVPTLAERLRQRGYATTAVVSNYLIDADHGFARGFDRFALLFRINSQTGEPAPIWIDALIVGHYWLPQIISHGTPKPDATSVVDEALREVQMTPQSRPLFLYIHLLDPHHPCDAPLARATRDWKPATADRQFDAKWSVDYDREVRYVDDQVKRLFDSSARLRSNTTVIVVADHGEELGERGNRGHGSNLHEAVVRVPLIVARPGGMPSDIQEPFSLTHLADLIESAAAVSPNEVVRAHLIPPPSPETTMTSVEHNNWKLVTIDTQRKRREQLFHLPDETRDQIGAQREIAASLRSTRDAMPQLGSTQIVDPEARAKLRALGYIH